MSCGQQLECCFIIKAALCCLLWYFFPICDINVLELIFLLGIDRKDVDVVELHDCFSVNELLTYEALGLCSEGDSY